jgi:hypothetical protein
MLKGMSKSAQHIEEQPAPATDWLLVGSILIAVVLAFICR